MDPPDCFKMTFPGLVRKNKSWLSMTFFSKNFFSRLIRTFHDLPEKDTFFPDFADSMNPAFLGTPHLFWLPCSWTYSVTAERVSQGHGGRYFWQKIIKILINNVIFSPFTCIIEHFYIHVLFILFDELSISRIRKFEVMQL